jgi:hypothetical protein
MQNVNKYNAIALSVFTALILFQLQGLTKTGRVSSVREYETIVRQPLPGTPARRISFSRSELLKDRVA